MNQLYTTFSSEIERAWTVPIADAMQLILKHPKSFDVKKNFFVEQKWIFRGTATTVDIRQRIRKVIDNTGLDCTPRCSHDTKYIFHTSKNQFQSRMELNAPLTGIEYATLRDTVFKDLPTVSKTRIIFLDIKNDQTYSLDIYPGEDKGSLEAELQSTASAALYTEPDWLKELIGGKDGN